MNKSKKIEYRVYEIARNIKCSWPGDGWYGGFSSKREALKEVKRLNLYPTYIVKVTYESVK